MSYDYSFLSQEHRCCSRLGCNTASGSGSLSAGEATASSCSRTSPNCSRQSNAVRRSTDRHTCHINHSCDWSSGNHHASHRRRTAPFQRGDVFVSVSHGQVQWRGPTAPWFNTEYGDFQLYHWHGFSPNQQQPLCNCFAGNRISIFNTSGTYGHFRKWLELDPLNDTLDATKNVYVGHAFHGSRDIFKFNSAGNLIGRFDVATEARGSDWIDLAPDQCTMYYTSEGRSIKRYNVCTQTQLPNFTSGLHGYGFALRRFPPSVLLVADTSDIHRLNASGQIVQSYDAAGQNCWFALNLDPDGRSFWSAD